MEVTIPVLTIIKYFQTRNILAITLLLVCSDEGTKVFLLKELSRLGFMTSFSILTIRENMDTRSGAVLDLMCSESETILAGMSKRKLFSIDREWLLIENVSETTSFKGTSVEDSHQGLYILPGSRVTLVQYSIYDQLAALYDMYRIVTWTPMEYKLLSRISMGQDSEIPKVEDRKNFKGVTLRYGSAIIMWNHFEGFGKVEHLAADRHAKIMFPVVKDMGLHLNFSITVTMDSNYGYSNKYGQFDAMMGRIQRGEIDFATPSMMLPERFDIADFTGDTDRMRSPVIFKQPSLSALLNIYLLPFSKSVWITAGISSVIFSLALLLSYYIGSRFYNLTDRFDISFGETVTTTLGCICQQGPSAVNASPRSRMTLFLLELTVFFLFVAYSAKIVALLQSSIENIKTISDLTNSPLEVGLEDIIYNKKFFAETVDPDLRKLSMKKIEPFGNKSYMTVNEGLEKLRTGLFAFKMESEWAHEVISDTFSESEKCGLSEINVFLLPMPSIPVPKRSGLREHITWSISRMTEVGLLYRAKHPYPNRVQKCDPRRSYTSVTLVDFIYALEIVGYGALVSFIILGLEIFPKFR